MQDEESRQKPEKPAFGDVLVEAIRGIRNEILLYGIVVIVFLVGSAALGIEVFRELEMPLLAFATLVLIVYLHARWGRARERILAKKRGR